jgi:death-on-curing protein
VTEGEMSFFYFEAALAVEMHDWIIENTGGLGGVKDIGILESTLAHVQNDSYYPNIETKLCYLVYSIIKNHSFTDGNKRSSLMIGAFFLELNGYDFIVQKFIRSMENYVVWVADNVIRRELLQKVIKSVIYEDEFSEDLRTEIYRAVTSAVD